VLSVVNSFVCFPGLITSKYRNIFMQMIMYRFLLNL